MVGSPAELQIFGGDIDYRKKEGCSFYKMDENNIQILREDLIEEFQALAKNAHQEKQKAPQGIQRRQVVVDA